MNWSLTVIGALLTLGSCTSTQLYSTGSIGRWEQVLYTGIGIDADVLCAGWGDSASTCDAFFDCSAQSVACVTNGFDVFAVPQEKLKYGFRYEHFGAQFEVIGCSPASDACDVALVESKCVARNQCGCLRSASPRRAGYFYFEERRGIIAFYIDGGDSEVKPGPASIPLSSYNLSAPSGFLRLPYKPPPTPARHC